jgi:hypothetical protein
MSTTFPSDDNTNITYKNSNTTTTDNTNANTNANNNTNNDYNRIPIMNHEILNDPARRPTLVAALKATGSSLILWDDVWIPTSRL